MDTDKKSGRHLYGRGWLGLIPLIGGFVGIGLIALGIFKYKDKKLTLIGFAALLFTVLIYSYLFYDLQYSERGRRTHIEFTERFLNDMVKNIEFYKLQKGAYPDSLKQLTEVDPNVIITDYFPIGKKDEKQSYYNYKKTDSSYTVYSSGFDGIPNTKDDIYPTIKIPKASQK